jgi:hypothetical protein
MVACRLLARYALKLDSLPDGNGATYGHAHEGLVLLYNIALCHRECGGEG